MSNPKRKYSIIFVQCLCLVSYSAAQDSKDETRQVPGKEPQATKFEPYIYESVPDINSSASEFSPVTDRWRQFYLGKWYDPYNQNVLKGDVPVFGGPGEEWFLETAATSDTTFERRRLPISVGFAATDRPQSNDVFGNGNQTIAVENIFTSFALIKGDTSFKPPEYEFRISPAFNVNYAEAEEIGALRADPSRGKERTDTQFSLQEFFVDKHLTNLTDRYDFISARVGIQRFSSDFRGFIFSDEAPGVRLFGNYDNNKWQYNLAWFSRLNKDTNSGLNSLFEQRYEDVVVANVYRQDAPVLGHTIQANIIYRGDTAGSHEDHYDENGFLVRPAAVGDRRPTNIYSTYYGLTGDGHFDRVNSTSALYFVSGSESHNSIAQRRTNIAAWMGAEELSYDIDWIRLRGSFLWASGDKDPYDGKATGFDGIFENPNFAGGNLAFFQREGLPLIAGGGVNLVNGSSFFPDLQPSKGEGQSNFVNPGLRLYNLGVDFELTPKTKLINNLSYLEFDDTSALEALRHDGGFDRAIGFDLSTGVIYRPFLNNNIQLRAGAGCLFPDSGIKRLYGEDLLFHTFTNVIFQY
jgi:hypothetical protein